MYNCWSSNNRWLCQKAFKPQSRVLGSKVKAKPAKENTLEVLLCGLSYKLSELCG